MPLDDPFGALVRETHATLAVCADFEDEASAPRRIVLSHLAARQNAGRVDRAGPHAGASCARAAVAAPGADARRDRLEAFDDALGCDGDEPAACCACRREQRRLARLAEVVRAGLARDAAGAVGARVARTCAAAQASGVGGVCRRGRTRPARGGAVAQRMRRRLPHSTSGARSAWPAGSTRLTRALQACGAWTTLMLDDAGLQVLAALHLEAGERHRRRRADDAGRIHPLGRRRRSKRRRFVPAAPQLDAPVVITPLERAMLRPFAAVVLAGADEKRLGRRTLAASVAERCSRRRARLADRCGAPRRGSDRLRATAALSTRLVVRRVDDGGEPLAASPLVQRLELALSHAGRKMGRRRSEDRARAAAPRCAASDAAGALVAAGAFERERVRCLAQLPLPILRAAHAGSARRPGARRRNREARLR